eukprot:CAMPEP_0170997532 /NCGR_PEP_ID=MMETSP0736-20130129/12917_1 /TAXON_ID=186038 /ORGANISM="Fragilariopsis kerguelensis, Strain L26-C5" /LENGTH=375 /DNA_ID=CAMNT_0011424243 /DNA_START=265 /DNA_END=1393 /DNA_ORIENTATION=-
MTITDININTDINNSNSNEGGINETDNYDGEEEDSNNSKSNNQKCTTMPTCSIKKMILGLLLLGFIIFVIVDSLTNKYARDTILQFLEWIEENPTLGVVAFIGVYFICTIFFIPGSILTLGAGFVFSASTSSLWTGVLLGTIAVFIGASLGAIASFLLGRYLFRDGFVARLTQKYTVFEAIDNALAEKGFRIMVLLRLSPIIPFNVLNYVSGITAIKLFHYCIACFAMLPGTILYVFLGASAGSLSEIGGKDADVDLDDEYIEQLEKEDKTVTIVVIVVGVIFGVLAIALTSYYAKQELNKVIEKKEQEEVVVAVERVEVATGDAGDNNKDNDSIISVGDNDNIADLKSRIEQITHITTDDMFCDMMNYDECGVV